MEACGRAGVRVGWGCTGQRLRLGLCAQGAAQAGGQAALGQALAEWNQLQKRKGHGGANRAPRRWEQPKRGQQMRGAGRQMHSTGRDSAPDRGLKQDSGSEKAAEAARTGVHSPKCLNAQLHGHTRARGRQGPRQGESAGGQLHGRVVASLTERSGTGQSGQVAQWSQANPMPWNCLLEHASLYVG